MKSKIVLYIITLNLLFLSLVTYSQCPVHLKDSTITISCGDSVLLSAYKDTIKPINITFNTKKLDPLLIVSQNGTLVDTSNHEYDCFGSAPEGIGYFMMNNSIGNPRFIQTKPLNLIQKGSNSATLCFMMKYGVQNNFSNYYDACEGIEGEKEGIYLEYYTDSWKTLQYWNPNPLGQLTSGGHETNLVNWNTYCIELPEDALTDHTRIRLIQKESNGVGYDIWAIDNISISLNSSGYTYSWDTDPVKSNYSIVVSPTRDNIYTVTYSNKNESCENKVKVFVIEPIDIKNAPSECKCQYLYIPNAFTPNGDGLNDYFLPIVFGIKEYELEVYNKAGQVIFKTKNRNELWSGYNEEQSVYTYRLKLKTLKDIVYIYEGIIMIIR